jgi:hypothetical protein
MWRGVRKPDYMTSIAMQRTQTDATWATKNENTFPLQRIDWTVEFPQQCYMLANTELKTKENPWTRCSLTSPEDLLQWVDFDRQKSVSSQHGNTAEGVRSASSELAVGIQHERSAQETQVKFSQRGSWEHRRTSSCLIVRVTYVWLVRCSNEVA